MATKELPPVPLTARVTEVLFAMTRGNLGIAIIRHSQGWGLVTMVIFVVP